MTTAGFGRAYSIAYHLRPPTRVRKVEAAGSIDLSFVEQPVLRHHHLKSAALKPQGDPITGRVPILFNAGFTPRQLTSDTDVLAAAASGEITLTDTEEFYRCSVVGPKH